MTKILYGHHFIPKEIYEDSIIERWFGAKLESFLKYVDVNQNRFTTLEHAHSNTDSLVLTFDDGYRSLLKYVMPYLIERNVPFTIFLRTDVLDNEIPYEIALAHLCISKPSIRLPNGEIKNTEDEQQAYAAYNKLRLQYKFSSVAKRGKIIESLYVINELGHLEQSPISFMSWSEVRAISKNPLVTIGAHTINHPALKKNLSYRDYTEIGSSKEILEYKLEISVDQFAYPYGANNFLSRYNAKKSGYSAAFTTQEFDYDPMNRSIYAIPRYNIETLI